MTDILFFGAIFLFVFILFYFFPTINGKGTLFGFVVHEDSSATDVLRKYRIGLTAIGLFFLSAIIGGIYYLPKSLVFTYIFSVLASGWWLHTNFLRSWRMRKIETFSRFAATLKPRRLIDFTNIGWEFAVILLMLVPTGILINFYPQLPESVPVHWNASGSADHWAAKSVVNVFFISFLGLYLQIFFVILKSDVVRARLRVPAENSDQILPLKEIVHQANINLLDWGRLMIGVLFGGINLLTLSILASPLMATLTNIFIWLGVVLLLIGVGIYGYQITLAERQIKAIAGQIVFQTANEEKGWDSGFFYSNPDDAAFCVEKLTGGGFTFNSAHKRIYLYAVMLGILAVSSIIALIFI